MIRNGGVTISGRAANKPSELVAGADQIEATLPSCRYVSRGGLKLEAALRAFSIDPRGCRCLDIGASTGGFTDCLLQHGAESVTAVDVGHSQMADNLLSDPRVRSFEGINARSLRPEEIGARGLCFDIIVVDLSFISLALVLPALYPLLAPGGQLVLLIKPQFEVGRKGLGKRGLVTNATLREQAVEKVCTAAANLGLGQLGVMESPITGGDGNLEYLAAFVKTNLQNNTSK